MTRVAAAVAAVVVVLAGACGNSPPATKVSLAVTTTTTTATMATSDAAGPTTAPPAPSQTVDAARAAPPPAKVTTRPRAGAPTTTAAPATTTTTAPPATAAPVTEPFESTVRPIDDAIAARMTASWRPGCPVGLDDLRLLTVSHWGFDGQPHVGELVVRARHADAVVKVFEAMFRARFPIQQLRLVDEFGADDDRSMAANNTSAFNCRTIAGSDRWSEHAYGGAVDINPVQNPYVTRSGVSPPAGAAFTSRAASTPGLITRDGPVVKAFAAIGWGWGGSWSSGRDYQHFSASGR